jgi:hypothetical protein
MRTTWTTFLRAGPGLQYAATDEVDAQVPVDVRGCDNGWCRIVFGDHSGYIKQDHLSAAPIPPVLVEGGKAQCFDTRRSGYGTTGEGERYCVLTGSPTADAHQ